MVKIFGDQLRISVWSLSTTNDRPLRNSSSLPSMPLLMTPIRALTMKMPPRVTPSMAKRNPPPSSPPMVPESRVRMRLSHIASRKPGWSAPFGAMWNRTTMSAKKAIMPMETRAR
jgi:hypothetical protein